MWHMLFPSLKPFAFCNTSQYHTEWHPYLGVRMYLPEDRRWNKVCLTVIWKASPLWLHPRSFFLPCRWVHLQQHVVQAPHMGVWWQGRLWRQLRRGHGNVWWVETMSPSAFKSFVKGLWWIFHKSLLSHFAQGNDLGLKLNCSMTRHCHHTHFVHGFPIEWFRIYLTATWYSSLFPP